MERLESDDLLPVRLDRNGTVQWQGRIWGTPQALACMLDLPVWSMPTLMAGVRPMWARFRSGRLFPVYAQDVVQRILRLFVQKTFQTSVRLQGYKKPLIFRLRSISSSVSRSRSLVRLKRFPRHLRLVPPPPSRGTIISLRDWKASAHPPSQGR
jgi:hypothetical protein